MGRGMREERDDDDRGSKENVGNKRSFLQLSDNERTLDPVQRIREEEGNIASGGRMSGLGKNCCYNHKYLCTRGAENREDEAGANL